MDKPQEVEKKISQLQNRQKILLNRKRSEEHRARTYRLIGRGAILEAVFPTVVNMEGEEVKAFLIALVTLSVAQLPLTPSSAAISRNFFFKAYRAWSRRAWVGDSWEMASARRSNSSSSAASSISRIIKSSGDCTRNMAWFSMPGLQSIE